MYRITFKYDNLGRGDVALWNNSICEKYWEARTGSLKDGNLINAIEPLMYKIFDQPVWTDEEAMKIGDAKGWKVRLYLNGGYTHLLIHPDGGKGGTLGCIGTEETAFDLKERISQILKEQQEITVDVRRV